MNIQARIDSESFQGSFFILIWVSKLPIRVIFHRQDLELVQTQAALENMVCDTDVIMNKYTTILPPTIFTALSPFQTPALFLKYRPLIP
jgi:hypothetical protein